MSRNLFRKDLVQVLLFLGWFLEGTSRFSRLKSLIAASVAFFLPQMNTDEHR